MNPFADNPISALRELKAVWPHDQVSLIGAAGLTCSMAHFHRQTNDLDIVVAVSLDSLPSALDRLPGWHRNPRIEHRWESPAGVRVDVIPAGPDLLAAGSVTWKSGLSMNLLGMNHALSRVKTFDLAPHLKLDVATVAVITLLKIIAYGENPAERTRDLGDIAHVLEHYIEGDDPQRYSDAVFDANLQFEEVSGFLLGRDLAEFADEREGAFVNDFIERVEGATDGGRTQTIIVNQAPVSWRTEPDRVLVAIRAFKRGFANA
jgi:predicted nucleotidyltransferase